MHASPSCHSALPSPSPATISTFVPLPCVPPPPPPSLLHDYWTPRFMSSFSTGFAPPISEARHDVESGVPVKHEETTYVFRDSGQGLGVQSGVALDQSASLFSPTSSSVATSDRHHFVASMSEADHANYPPSTQAHYYSYEGVPSVPLPTNSSNQSYSQPQISTSIRHTPAATFNALFPPPQAVTLVTQTTDASRTSPSSRSSSATSYRYRPYSRASVSSIGDLSAFDSNPPTPASLTSPSSSSLQNSTPGASFQPGTSCSIGEHSLTATDLSNSHSANTSLSAYTDYRGHSGQLPGGTAPSGLAGAQSFNPALTAVPSSGLPLWPGASTYRSRAKQKYPKHSRAPSVDYPPDASVPHNTRLSYTSPTPVHQHPVSSTSRALLTPYSSSPQRQLPIAGNLPAQYLNQFASSVLAEPGSEHTLSDTQASVQLFAFNNMYHGEGDLDPLEEYEEDDVLTGLQEGSPTSYIPHGDFAAGASEDGGKKDEKQVRRRSSKGK